MNRPALAEVWPLSPLQEGLLFHAGYDKQAHDFYVRQQTLELAGQLDVSVLRISWEALLERHANLRASFLNRGTGAPVQVIVRGVALPWREADLSGLPGAEAEAAAEALAQAELERGFDLKVPPLLRLLLVKLGPSRHRLMITMHHIVLDGWSLQVLFEEFSQVYAAGGDDTVLGPAVSYREYLAWLARQDREAARAAWREALTGAQEPTMVAPGAREAGAVLPRHVVTYAGRVLTGRLTGAARSAGMTLNTVLQGAWAVLVGLLADRGDVVFGITVAGRPAELAGVERMLGLFLNTVPVRVRLNPEGAFGKMLSGLQAEQSVLLEHQHLGLAEIQRVAGSGATFDTLLNYGNYLRSEGGALRLGGLRVSGSMAEEASHYPLALVVTPTEETELLLVFNPDVFDEATAESLSGRLVRVLEQVVASPDVRLGDLEVVSAAERALVLREWNETDHPRPAGSLGDLFSERAGLLPDAVAVHAPDGQLTYQALDAVSSRVARELAARGVGPEDRVAVVMGRSTELIAVLLGVLKSGAAYVPVDPGYPAARVELMLAGAAPVLAICDQGTAALVGTAGCPVVTWGEPALAAALLSRDASPVVDADRVAPLR